MARLSFGIGHSWHTIQGEFHEGVDPLDGILAPPDSFRTDRRLYCFGEGNLVYRPLRYEQMMRAAESFDVRARRMFGGMGIYTGEKMFAFLIGDEIGLKLCGEDLEEAMLIPGAGPLRPDPNSEPMKDYVRMPREVLDNYEIFLSWVERSATYARTRMHRIAS